MIRQAELNDLDQLVAIENQTFTLDRFSRRTFRYLLSKANAVTLVANQEGQVAEDSVLGDKLYEKILREFRRRVELRRG
jgi:ribosomal protein S18 acetylase RimI-like enzyme